MRTVNTLLVLTCAALWYSAALAQSAPSPTWKWRESGGQIVVSDIPPPRSVPDRDILERPTTAQRRTPATTPAASAPAPAPAPAPTNAAPRVDPELEARRRRAAEELTAQQRQQQAQDAAQRADNCARAKTHMQALAEGQRLTRTNAQGEREVLDDKGRAEEMQRMRAVIASDCR
jgi:type IV secretory pathway VirB10-like protein